MRAIACIFLLVMLAPSLCLGAEQIPDTALSKLVTIECANARLHTVVEQLSEQSGIAIRCGRDGRDWQVRDIPVTVCAKDIPLGRLLKSISASTHLLLSKEQTGQTTIYRIWRDSKRRKELDDFFKAKDAADLAGIAWDWDAVCKLKDSAASDDRTIEQYRNLGAILSSLGPDSKSRVMSGGYIKCATANLAESARGSMGNMLQGLMTVFQPNVPSLTVDDMQRSGMAVYLDRDDLGRLGAWVATGVDILNSNGDVEKAFICRFPAMSDRAVKQKVVDGSERPAQPKPPAFQAPDGDWKELVCDEAWNMPMLQAKVSLEAPKDKDQVTVGNLLAALSKASGLTIVCEDFASHRRIPSPARLYAKDTTVKAVLQGLSYRSPARLSQADFVWRINEKDKAIIGTSDTWPFHHINLVSEGFLTYLKDKLNGDGVDLDDYLKVMALERGQMEEWIKYSPDLQILDAYGQPSHKEFWALYDSLSPLQKAQARTDAGLPMANLQPAYVAYLISRYNRNEADKAHHHPLSKSEPKEFPYDEQSIASLVMKVKKENRPQVRTSWSRGSGESLETSNWPLGPFMVDTYEMTIEVTQNGQMRTLNLGGPMGLPFRSPEREKALGVKPVEQ